jgi:hypothetical protein
MHLLFLKLDMMVLEDNEFEIPELYLGRDVIKSILPAFIYTRICMNGIISRHLLRSCGLQLRILNLMWRKDGVSNASQARHFASS